MRREAAPPSNVCSFWLPRTCGFDCHWTWRRDHRRSRGPAKLFVRRDTAADTARRAGGGPDAGQLCGQMEAGGDAARVPVARRRPLLTSGGHLDEANLQPVRVEGLPAPARHGCELGASLPAQPVDLQKGQRSGLPPTPGPVRVPLLTRPSCADSPNCPSPYVRFSPSALNRVLQK